MSPPTKGKTMKRNMNRFQLLRHIEDSRWSLLPVSREAIPSEAIEDTNAVTSTTMPPFYDLPVELKLNVLSKLPAREIQTARQVSKHMQNLIDLKDNRTLLVSDDSKMALAAIEGALQNISNFDASKTDPLQLLHQLLRLQGSRYGSPKAASVIWSRHHGLHVVNGINQDNSLHFMLNDLTEMHFNGEVHGRIISEEDFMDHWNYHPFFFASIGISADMIRDMYRRVKAGELNGVPEDRDMIYWLQDDHERVCKLLGAPLIPEYLRDYLGYAVRPKWAYERAMAEFAEPGTLTDLCIMAIKEQLILF